MRHIAMQMFSVPTRIFNAINAQRAADGGPGVDVQMAHPADVTGAAEINNARVAKLTSGGGGGDGGRVDKTCSFSL